MSVGIIDLSRFYACLSTDTKPTNPTNILLMEIDTGSYFCWDGNSWETFNAPTAQDGWRLASKTVTFTGDAGLGAVGSVALFTVTGDVLTRNLGAEVTTNLVDAGGGAPATLDFGVTGNTGLFTGDTPIDPADGWDAGEWNVLDTGASVGGAGVNMREFFISANIIATVANEAINSGVIVVYVWWQPLSSGASVVAA